MTRSHSFAVAGDSILNRRITAPDDRRLAAIRDRTTEADVSIANLETLLNDHQGSPAPRSMAFFSGLYLSAAPWVVDELTSFGFDAFAAANNHTGDYLSNGFELTMDALDERSIPYAGLGRTLTDAREPAYVDTAAGRVALVGATSTVTPGTEAQDPGHGCAGRPGVSPLNLETRYVLPSDQLAALRQASRSLGLEEIKEERRSAGLPTEYDTDDGDFRFLEVGRGHGESLAFEEGDTAKIYQKPDDVDCDAIVSTVEEANFHADWVVVSLHAHEGVNGAYNDDSIPPFLETFARRCIDAGADLFIGHGPHTLRGIEIYDGSPIFYSLGNFICNIDYVTDIPIDIYERYDLDQNELRPSAVHEQLLTDRRYWESVLPVCRFENGELTAVELYPVELGFDERPRHGFPLLAEGEEGTRILSRLGDLSGAYDTSLEIADGVGYLEV